MDDFGVVKITDFGLSRILAETSKWMVTTTNSVWGTLRWMAPELLDFQTDQSGKVVVTPRTDVYSFGMTALVSMISS